MMPFTVPLWALKLWPIVKPLMKWIVLALAVASFLTAFAAWQYHRGAQHERDAQAARVAAAKAHVVKVEAKADAITADVGQKAEAHQVEIRTVTRTLIEKVPVYVTVKADAGCAVPRGFIVLHDAAAAGRLPPVPDAAGQPDEPSGVALSTVASVVAGNYGACRADQSRLTDLQDWIRQQAANR